ncbi:MAG: sigma 54-interacting transcriptional regulator [Desulfosarcina sp.]|nr:sigma 54-interacting transcriptional regulator [Desulfosarcina sp.]MBC2767476.1 sigma 54-interacting transcriptional regulator [Desulfosarcina sp.]
MPDQPTDRSILPDLGALDFLPVFDAFDEGIIISDTHGRILFYNETQAGIDDLRPGKVIGEKVADIYQLNWHDSMIFKCMEANAPIIGRLFFYRTFKGKLANTIHSVFPLHVNEVLVGAICFVKNYNILEKVMTGFSTLSPNAHPELANGTRYQFTDIVGADKSFLHALTMARLAAETHSPVMLFGETGSGKEMFAQSIHNYSSRKDSPFVGINCAAIPDTLLEGLLFGTVKGAFTGAVDKIGLFEQADGGTVFLDEINSMPIALQAKLLRVLQEKKIRRVGASGEVSIAVKIISSVNLPAHKAIRERQLRMDLFYRLAVVYIAIPPLREQPEGIETLARHFIYKNNLALGKQVNGVSEPVMQFFRSYHWPGNVRELEHLIEGAMNTIGPDTTLRISHLPPHLLLDQIRDEDPPLHVLPAERSGKKTDEETDILDIGTASPGIGVRDLREQRQEQERNMIDEALTAAGGNVSETARMLNVSRQLIHYKMRKYGLVRERYRGRARNKRIG